MKITYLLTTDIDFGLISEDIADGAIKVDKKLWNKYVTTRYEFDKIHGKLIEKIGKRKRYKEHDKWLIKHVLRIIENWPFCIKVRFFNIIKSFK